MMITFTASAQTKVKTTAKTTTAKKKIVKKVERVRITRSPLDLLYIPKYRQFMITAGAITSGQNYTSEYFVPPIAQVQGSFSEDIKEQRTKGFVSIDYAIMKGFILGATFSNSFTNSIKSESTPGSSTAFTNYDEDNSGFDDPEIHGLYRLLFQREKGFTIDVFGSLTIGVQSAQRAEGDYESTINAYRGNFIPNQSLTQNGNAANGGTDIRFGIRSGRKHSPTFEYMFETDITFKTARDYDVLRAYSVNNFIFNNLNYEEDAQLNFHAGATGQFLLGDVVALYLGADFFYFGQRELNATYPNSAQETTNIDALTGFGGKLGLKFKVIPNSLVIGIEGNYTSFGNAQAITKVNSTESYRYQMNSNTGFGGSLKAQIFF